VGDTIDVPPQRDILSRGRHCLEEGESRRYVDERKGSHGLMQPTPTEKAYEKGITLLKEGCIFNEFGTRRRRSFRTQDDVVAGLVRADKALAPQSRGGNFLGTSNVCRGDLVKWRLIVSPGPSSSKTRSHSRWNHCPRMVHGCTCLSIKVAHFRSQNSVDSCYSWV